jgi:diketogulonate reductase-like aldo/keto reductase
VPAPRQAREWYREDLVGRGVRQGGVAREGLFLTSKIHPRDLGRGATRKALRRALRDLRTDYIDLLLIHYPRCSDGLGCKKGGPAVRTWGRASRAAPGPSART